MATNSLSAALQAKTGRCTHPSRASAFAHSLSTTWGVSTAAEKSSMPRCATWNRPLKSSSASTPLRSRQQVKSRVKLSIKKSREKLLTFTQLRCRHTPQPLRHPIRAQTPRGSIIMPEEHCIRALCQSKETYLRDLLAHAYLHTRTSHHRPRLCTPTPRLRCSSPSTTMQALRKTHPSFRSRAYLCWLRNSAPGGGRTHTHTHTLRLATPMIPSLRQRRGMASMVPGLACWWPRITTLLRSWRP